MSSIEVASILSQISLFLISLPHIYCNILIFAILKFWTWKFLSDQRLFPYNIIVLCRTCVNDTFLSHGTPDACLVSQFHSFYTNMVSDVLIYHFDNRFEILETFALLNDLCIKFQFYTRLMYYVTKTCTSSILLLYLNPLNYRVCFKTSHLTLAPSQISLIGLYHPQITYTFWHLTLNLFNNNEIH